MNNLTIAPGSQQAWQAKQINQAVSIINQGGIVAYPTEAVYGLGCDPDNDAVIEKLLRIKNRSSTKGLILVSDDFSRLKPYLEQVSPEIAQRAFQTWPGPYTWLWPVRNSVSHLLRGEFETLAVRVTSHPLVQQLCHYLGKPLVSTSANPAAQPPAISCEQVKNYFPVGIDLVIEGELGSAPRPSEIRNLVSNQVVRE